MSRRRSRRCARGSANRSTTSGPEYSGIAAAGGGIYARWRADQGITAGATWTWLDMSLRHSLAQATGSLQPAADPTGGGFFKGQPTVYSDGTNWIRSDEGAAAWKWLHSAGYTIAMCWRDDAVPINATCGWVATAGDAGPSNTGMLIRMGATNSLHYAQNGSGTYLYSQNVGGLALATVNRRYFQGDFSAGFGRIYDGSSYTNTAVVGSVSSGNPTNALTVFDTASPTLLPAKGHLAELIIYNRMKSQAQLDIVHAYFAARYI